MGRGVCLPLPLPPGVRTAPSLGTCCPWAEGGTLVPPGPLALQVHPSSIAFLRPENKAQRPPSPCRDPSLMAQLTPQPKTSLLLPDWHPAVPKQPRQPSQGQEVSAGTDTPDTQGTASTGLRWSQAPGRASWARARRRAHRQWDIHMPTHRSTQAYKQVTARSSLCRDFSLPRPPLWTLTSSYPQPLRRPGCLEPAGLAQ